MGTVVRKILEHIPMPLGIVDEEWVPEEFMSRQEWQEVVESVVARLRTQLRSPAFGLSEPEISVHYHKPFEQFVKMVEKKIGNGPA